MLPVKRIMKTHLNLCKCNERVARILRNTEDNDSGSENKENVRAKSVSKKNGKSKSNVGGMKIKLDKNTASGVELSAKIDCKSVKLPKSCFCRCDRPFFKERK